MSHFFQIPVRVGPSSPSTFIPKRDSKYLGVTLDTSLTWQPHIKMITAQVSQRIRSLTFLGKNNPCSSQILSRIYTACQRPVMAYIHSVLLLTAAHYRLGHNRVIDRRPLRIILRRPLPPNSTSNRLLYTMNTLFPDLVSFLTKLNTKYVKNASTRLSIQSSAASLNRSTRNKKHVPLSSLIACWPFPTLQTDTTDEHHRRLH